MQSVAAHLCKLTSYGYYGDNAYRGNWEDYAKRNGFVCRPGTLFKGEDGLQHFCQ